MKSGPSTAHFVDRTTKLGHDQSIGLDIVVLVQEIVVSAEADDCLSNKRTRITQMLLINIEFLTSETTTLDAVAPR